MSFHADRVQHGIRTAPGDSAQFTDGVLGKVQRLDAVARGHGTAFGYRINADDLVPQMRANARGELPYRPQAEDGQRAAVGNIGVLHALPCGGQNVREE